MSQAAIYYGTSRNPINYAKNWEYSLNSTAALITKYIGKNKNVVVPRKIEGKPVIVQNNVNNAYGVFANNKNILSVKFGEGVRITNNNMAYTFHNCTNLKQAPNIPNSVTNMSYTFYNCTNLTQAPNIPDSVTNMYSTFSSCYNLTQAPVIPDSVTDVYQTFYNCRNLTQAPNIPNGVTGMVQTFRGCNKLTQAPNIPNSVTNMVYTFYYCTNLTQAPNIPNSVINMYETFRNCANLIGNIIIKSENITNFRNCFYNTSKAKNVYIPYKYANGVNTKTYNAAFNTGVGINGKNGVTVYDINTYTG